MLKLIGLGLNVYGITLEGLIEARSSDKVYVELYTSIIPGLTLDILKGVIGKELNLLKRRDLEDGYERIIEEAGRCDIALLTPGDPLIATTHMSLVIEAYKRGIPVKVVNSASIISAISSATGLHIYNFGRIVTLTKVRGGALPLTVYEVVEDNLSRGLHTLILLDLDVEEGYWVSIGEAVEILEIMEARMGRSVFGSDRLVVGVARVGSTDFIVKADRLSKIKYYDFGGPPHSLVVPGRLHFMEVEALLCLAEAPRDLLRKS
ncbi:MAG: diphthine synthase [Nitrososphaerota archaeon]|nr:diphthine synthase [Candidatus Bathyarchaeota archaeon]MCX8161966.1 diphthine synthase [Candidatus Bathyarchaeota archaeon]MDW8062341.1 diphthine synthase [Nitrososphaerota archaeon]